MYRNKNKDNLKEQQGQLKCFSIKYLSLGIVHKTSDNL